MELSLVEARGLALGAQGFGRRPAKAAMAHVRKTASKVLAIHIDSINVLVRSHYLIAYSRLGAYPMDAIDTLAYKRRELFEGWAHSTGLMPLHLYPLLRYKMQWRRQASARSPNGEWIDPAFVDQVYDEVAARGPLTVGELSSGNASRGAWWGWSHGKTALEYLLYCGRVAVAGREDFTRLYDIAERVIPGAVLDAPAPDPEESQKQLICLAANALGVATARQLVWYFGLHQNYAAPKGPNGKAPRATWPRLVRELVDEGRLNAVEVETWPEPGYMFPSARIPRSIDVRALLSPFDELVRSSAELTFGFTQHLGQQLYVPAAKRMYGYYVLPFLLGDQLVGRCDLKADRQSRALLVQSAYVEPGHDAKRVAGELADELRQLQTWLDLDRTVVADRGDLAVALKRSLRRPPRPDKSVVR